jgi:DNA-binding NtrC family response regulator
MAQGFVLDPDESLGEILRSALQGEGHTAVEAGGGSAAVRQLRLAITAMVVLLDDTRLCRESAIPVRALAADSVPARQHVDILAMMDQLPCPPAVADLIACLPSQVLVKPFELSRLLALVSQAGRSPAAVR